MVLIGLGGNALPHECRVGPTPIIPICASARSTCRCSGYTSGPSKSFFFEIIGWKLLSRTATRVLHDTLPTTTEYVCLGGVQQGIIGVVIIVSKGTISHSIHRHIGRRATRLGTGKVAPNLTIVIINSSPTSTICMEGGRGTYSRINFCDRGCTLPTDAARGRLGSLISRLGTHPRVDNVLYRLPLPTRLSSGRIVTHVGPVGSISTFRPIGINTVVVNSCRFLPYAPTKVVRLVRSTNMSPINGGTIIVNEDGVINGPVTVLLLRRGTAIRVTRSGARGLTSMAGDTSVLITTINGTGFMATSVIGPNTIIVSINVGESRGNGLYNSISFRDITPGYSFVAPIPNKMNPVAVSVLVRGALATTGVRGNIR